MMIRIFSSNFIVAAVTMMAIIHNNNGGVYAESKNELLASLDEAVNAAYDGGRHCGAGYGRRGGYGPRANQ